MSDRLELMWPNKHQFLLVPKDDAGKPVWVARDHAAAQEVRLTEFVGSHGETNDADPYSDNLLFRGDSLDALRLLAEVPEYARHYRGKVKLVYIDPPFNTGQAFAHYDDWMEHSTWLSFMSGRLAAIKDLLSEDGSIWVHLDDAEVHRMRCLMDETFGANHFAGEIVWQKADSPRSDAKGLSISHDSILVYRKSTAWSPNRLPRLKSTDAAFGNKDGDPVLWVKKDPTAPGARTHQGMVYAIQHPISGGLVYPGVGRHWAMEQSWMHAEMSHYARYEFRDIDDAAARSRICGIDAAQVRKSVKALMLVDSLEVASEQAQRVYDAGCWPTIYLTGSGSTRGLQRKHYISNDGRVPESWWPHADVGHNRAAKNEIKALFSDRHPFATPKPERLLQRIIHIGSNEGDIVLDCFCGSGTTVAVAHKMKRRWVAVEIVSETIADFIGPRLRRVVDGRDQGGISAPIATREPVEDLPDGLSTQELKEAAMALKKLRTAKLLPETLDTEALEQSLRKLAKTRVVEGPSAWSGGGGFREVDVSPSMYKVTPLGVVLADWATNGRFARAVAGQLGFEWQPTADSPLCGASGRMRLAVFDGAVGIEEVGNVVAALGEGERVTIVAKAVLPGVEEFLAEHSHGSRVIKAPRDLLNGRSRRRPKLEQL